MDRPKAKTHTVSLYPKDEALLARLTRTLAKELGWVSKSDAVRIAIKEATASRGIK